MSNNKVRLGIIGIGNMGSSHLYAYTSGQLPEVEVTAVADINPDRLEFAKDEHESVLTFNTADELIESGAVDAVLIATPHYYHPPIAIKAMKAGLHVMCEKPAGVYTKQVRLMNETAAQCDVVFGIMYNQRTNCLYRKARELVQGGEFGAFKRMNW